MLMAINCLPDIQKSSYQFIDRRNNKLESTNIPVESSFDGSLIIGIPLVFPKADNIISSGIIWLKE